SLAYHGVPGLASCAATRPPLIECGPKLHHLHPPDQLSFLLADWPGQSPQGVQGSPCRRVPIDRVPTGSGWAGVSPNYPLSPHSLAVVARRVISPHKQLNFNKSRERLLSALALRLLACANASNPVCGYLRPPL